MAKTFINKTITVEKKSANLHSFFLCFYQNVNSITFYAFWDAVKRPHLH